MAKMIVNLSRLASNPASYYVQKDSIQQKFEREFEAIPSGRIKEYFTGKLVFKF